MLIGSLILITIIFSTNGLPYSLQTETSQTGLYHIVIDFLKIWYFNIGYIYVYGRISRLFYSK